MIQESKLKKICNLKIMNAVFIEGEAGISFENGTNLSIYNRFELEGFNLEDVHLLVGSFITDVQECEEIILICFRNNLKLRIDMRDEAYTGPEALQLCVPGEPIIIWN